MIWRILKTLLKSVDIQVRMHSGDQLVVVVKFGDHEIVRRTIDFIPGA